MEAHRVNQNAEVFAAIIRGIIPTRRDIIVSGIISVTVVGLAIYGALHLLGVA
jgi:hypothetical protein